MGCSLQQYRSAIGRFGSGAGRPAGRRSRDSVEGGGGGGKALFLLLFSLAFSTILPAAGPPLLLLTFFLFLIDSGAGRAAGLVVAAKPAAGSLLLHLSLYAARGLVEAAKPAHIWGAGALLLYLSLYAAWDPVRSTAAGLVQALLMRAGVERNPGPAGQRDEIQRVENEMGRRLSPDELQFVQNQLTRNTILKIQVNQRSGEQKANLTTLQRNIQHAKERDMKGCDPHLLIGKSPAKTAAQRREATRVRLAAPDQREAARGRMAAPAQREAGRVRKVVARAGGLTEERKADVAAGKKKNKKTSVYSGDALRNKEIFAGDFIIEPLEEDKSDALGELGSSQCQHCGALRWDCLPNLTCCQVEP